jgi:hypothetical protein
MLIVTGSAQQQGAQVDVCCLPLCITLGLQVTEVHDIVSDQAKATWTQWDLGWVTN